MQSPLGDVTLNIGSAMTSIEGVKFWLGFAPVAANGKVFVHNIDAEKNLRPLGQNPLWPSSGQRSIVIDPGHGGDNTGTRSVVDGALEKGFTLDWALRLRALLIDRGWRVILTRTNDLDVALSNRVAIAEVSHADMFLSLHFNSSAPRQDQSGIETFCLTPAGLPSTLTRDYEDDSTVVFPNNAFDDQNLQLAIRIHRALLDTTRQVDRGVRRARFMTVLRGQKRASVLLEGGFLSNPAEARLIATPAYRQKLAEAVADALTPSDHRNTAAVGKSTP